MMCRYASVSDRATSGPGLTALIVDSSFAGTGAAALPAPTTPRRPWLPVTGWAGRRTGTGNQPEPALIESCHRTTVSMNQTSRKVEHSAGQIVIGALKAELYGPVPSILIADCLDVVEAADRHDSHSAFSHDPNVLARRLEREVPDYIGRSSPPSTANAAAARYCSPT